MTQKEEYEVLYNWAEEEVESEAAASADAQAAAYELDPFAYQH